MNAHKQAAMIRNCAALLGWCMVTSGAWQLSPAIGLITGGSLLLAALTAGQFAGQRRNH